MKCPKCKGDMEKGYIHGNKFPLTWSDKPNKWWVFSGEQLGKSGGLFGTPKLEAYRCSKCRIGIFSY